MKERIAGIVSFVGAVGILLFSFYILYIEKIEVNEKPIFLLLITTSISVVLFVIWTKFGKLERNELERIEYENQILDKKIQQKELKKKLES